MRTRREGFALALVVLLIMATVTLATAAAVLGSGSWLVSQYKERQGQLASIADQGMEEGRAIINGNKALYPDSSFTTIESGAPVLAASGAFIPGVTRSIYVGPIGVSTGQYGVFGSVVAVAEAANGDRVIRRMEVMQESFAKFAYFTDVEGTIAFGGGDQLFGPVHSNDDIEIYSSGATFHGAVTTGGRLVGRAYGRFNAGFTERAQRIPMPQTADLNKLRGYAQLGGTAFVGTTAGGAGQATTRIEFISIDLNADGDATDDDEGFMRVYQNTTNAAAPAYIVGARTVGGRGIGDSRNCGDYHGTTFVKAIEHGATGNTPFPGVHSWAWALQNGTGRTCYPGGDPRLTNGFIPNDTIVANGRWLPYAGTPDPRLGARPDRGYLHPLSRVHNPNFKGVVFVDGKIAISGTLRARLTLAATSDIIIIDDMRYSVDPGAGTCKDILGLFAGVDVMVADNTMNAPQQVGGTAYFTLDDTRDEFIHGVVLALSNFEVQNYNSGSNSAEDCGTTDWGRGCLFLTGGIIQYMRGAVGTASGTGYLKRYSYDPCAFSNPPPYFPTTGRFARGRVFDVPVVDFSPAALFDALTPN